MEENNGFIDEIEDEILNSSMQNFFNPNSLRVKTVSITIDYILGKIQHNEIEFSANFNRNQSIWTPEQQSRLIESIIIRFPLPVFYFDGTNYERWLVIDGLQRLNSLKSFILDKELKLTGLEFLMELEGKSWEELSRPLQRQINESILQCYVIEEGDDYAKFNIFKRINSTGTPYTNQEIRTAFFSNEAEFLRSLAESKEFLKATQYKIKRDRYQDLEFVNRFLAFYLFDIEEYYNNDIDIFMNKSLEKLSYLSESEKVVISLNFKQAMDLVWDIFNENSFSKSPDSHYINKALFEIISSNFAKLCDNERAVILSKKERFKSFFYESVKNNFFDSLSINTGGKANVVLRHQEFNNIIKQVINE